MGGIESSPAESLKAGAEFCCRHPAHGRV